MQYTPGLLTFTARILRAVQGLYPDPNTKVDIGRFLEPLAPPAHRERFFTLLTPWLRAARGADVSAQIWLIKQKVSAAELVALLQDFHDYLQTIFATANIFRQMAWLLGTYGWRQGELSTLNTGFDLIGAVGYIFQGEFSPLRMTVLDTLHTKLQQSLGLPEVRSLTEWNDEPGRTLGDVLSLLESCAVEIETV